MLGTCKLCLTESVELRKSHIIPEFHYKPCYDEKHRFFRLSTKGPKIKAFEQKGHRERMLCHACETKLSKWEGYAKNILVDGGLAAARKFNWGFEFHGVDYPQFKLYLLSILWRMGASELSMFEMVKLGNHEEKLRLTLVSEDPLDEHVYPVLFVGVTLDGRFLSDFIVPPSVARDDGFHLYRCVINGILYTFCVGSHRLSKDMEKFAINREGVLNLPIMEVRGIPFLYEHFRAIHTAIQQAKQGVAPNA
jgi:hypothetical protein